MKDDGSQITCPTEEEVYQRLGLDWVPPELREDRGEIEAARAGSAGRGDPARHLLTPFRPRPSVQGVFFEVAAGRGAGVRSMLSRDALWFLPFWGPPGAGEPILGPEYASQPPC